MNRVYCEYIADRIEKEFQVEVDRGGFDPTTSCAEPGISVNWISEELLTVEKALDLTKTFLDQTRRPFIGAVGGRGYTISRVQFSSGPNPDATLTSFAWPNPLTSAPKVQTTTPDALFAQPVEYSIIAILIHEFFHAFDYFTAQAQFLPQVQVITLDSLISREIVRIIVCLDFGPFWALFRRVTPSYVRNSGDGLAARCEIRHF